MYSVRMRAEKDGLHLSGAEGIFGAKDVQGAASAMVERAMRLKTRPGGIYLSIEPIPLKPKMISALPVSTVKSASVADARSAAEVFLKDAGISSRAIRAALAAIRPPAMRGAALLCAETGRRLDTSKKRGVRASVFGITPGAQKTLQKKLAGCGITHRRAFEAMLLAAKVASCPFILAEFCVSDDPEYATGYVSSRKNGYVRIENLKPKKSPEGGRAFFLEKDAPVEAVIDYLEREPVIISRAGRMRGEICPL
ncbi:MAG: 6-carboxyhexanoate--CoA ligase [Actinomycetota bacterium]|nr:6-carboxyhexanoate--CoA ligase [Actinomycetota bacterium]